MLISNTQGQEAWRFHHNIAKAVLLRSADEKLFIFRGYSISIFSLD